MKIPKQQILEFVEGGASAIARAANELPDWIDTDRDASLLSDFGVDVGALLHQFNGAQRV